MSRLIRWVIAGLVTAAVFVLGAWLSGALIFPLLVRGTADRWALAGGTAAVIASLTAVWGASWAQSADPGPAAGPASVAATDRSVAFRGRNDGTIITGDGTTGDGPADPRLR